jgi:hypothetical protein
MLNFIVAGLAGFEPVTSAVTGRRSKPAELQSHYGYKMTKYPNIVKGHKKTTLNL